MPKFEMYFPVNPVHINQPFSVNGAYYQANGINIKGHNGVDFQAYHGQPIYSAHDGSAYYEVDENQGHGVVIRTNEPFDFNGTPTYYKSIYWHFCDPIKEPKYESPIHAKSAGNPNLAVPVKRGDLIGYADTTGLATGPHLHFGLKPQAQNEGNGIWYNLEQNNGYLGCIDPMPYFNGKFADEPIDQPIQATNVANIATQKVEGGNVGLANVLYSIVDFVKKFWRS